FETPFHRATGSLAVPLDTMPYNQGDSRCIDIRIPPAEVTGIFRQHVQPAVGAQDEELLSAAPTATIKEEGNLIAVGTQIERRRRLPPEPDVHFGRIHVVVNRRRGIPLDHTLGVDEIIHARWRERRARIGGEHCRALRATRRLFVNHVPSRRGARDRLVEWVSLRYRFIETPISAECETRRLI